jgi:ribosome biogenesis GTPase
MQGLIIKIISGDYFVKINDEVIKCKPLGVFRHKKITPKVGDIVEVEDNTIIKIQDRKNELIRPVVANIDKVFIVTSLVEPDLNLNLLDRIICQAEYNNIEIILVFTKVDLTDHTKYNNIFEYYKSLDYKIFLAPTDYELIKQEINDNVCVVAGQSGVGKSTLINLFDNFNIKTDEISKALGRGKHTTRCSELLQVGTGFIADTPGFGMVDLDMDLVSLSHSFKEFFECKCKFNPCLHLNEPHCQVKEKVNNNEILKSRYDNYLDFVNEIKNKKIKY